MIYKINFPHVFKIKRSYTETSWKANEKERKLRIHNITAKAALKFGSEA